MDLIIKILGRSSWFKKLWQKHKFLCIPAVVFCCIALYVLVYIIPQISPIIISKFVSGENNFEKNKRPNSSQSKLEEKPNKLNEEVKGVEDQKNKSEIECNFQENDKCEWIGKNRFEMSGDKEDIFKPILTKEFPEGREMFLDKNISSDFIAYLNFVPQNDKEISLTLNYGNYWRVIIGDGDYNKVMIQRHQKANNPETKWIDVKSESGNKWIRRNIGLSAGMPMEIKIVSSSGLNAAVLNFKLQISGYLKNKTIKEPVFEEDYRVVVDKLGDECMDKLGIGILDTKNSGVSVKLERFGLK